MKPIFLKYSILAFLLVTGRANAAELKAVPTFENCSLYWDGQLPPAHTVQVRIKGGENWTDGLPLSVSPASSVWRGSLFGLTENTDYETRLVTDGGSVVAQASFRTWNSAPPVATAYTLAELAPDGTSLQINEKGTADGWLRITGTPGHDTLDGGETAEETLLLENASFIILEGLTIRGGRKHGITVRNCDNIRIVNCDISGFGRIGKQALCYGGDGKYSDTDKSIINNDAGVNLDDSANVVVECCFIHAPRNHANPWRFSHPTGPNAVYVRSRGGAVLRYNDFVGCDTRRWNDAVEGWYNAKDEGGFYRDADIYGNLFAFSNDDGIELDGGQMNIRTYKNRFEATYCGISTAPCRIGPSYVFRNLVAELGDEESFSENGIKNNYGKFGYGRIFFFNNTIAVKYSVSGTMAPYPEDPVESAREASFVKIFSRNNVFTSRRTLIPVNWAVKYTSDLDHDLLYTPRQEVGDLTRQGLEEAGQYKHAVWQNPLFRNADAGDYALADNSPALAGGVPVPGIAEADASGAVRRGAVDSGDPFAQLPYRPLPVALDLGRVLLDATKPEQAVTVTATVAAETRGMPLAFTIRKNDDCGWFNVSPETGMLKPGETQTFTVTLQADKLPDRRRPAGAFLVRFESGLSRPVLVYAENMPNVEAMRLPETGWHILAEAESFAPEQTVRDEHAANASGGACVALPEKGVEEGTEPSTFNFSFDVPETGEYLVYLRVKSPILPGRSAFRVTLVRSGGEPERIMLRADEQWRWCGISPPGSGGNERRQNRHYAVLKLEKGKHEYSLASNNGLLIDTVLVTNDRTPLE